MSRALTKIKIKGHFIPDIDWQDIPRFAIITGVNGAGKTQILQAIDSVATGNGRFPKGICESDLKIKPEEYGYVPWQQNHGNLGVAKHSQFEDGLEKFVNQCKRNSIRQGNEQEYRVLNYIQDVLGQNPQGQSDSFYLTQRFRDAYKDAWISTVETTKNEHISRLFVQYQVNYEEVIVRNYNAETGSSIPREQIEKDLNIPPWEMINKLFQEYGFKYRITHPERGGGTFKVEFYKLGEGQAKIQFSALSSGEQMIVTLILWSFNEKLGQLKRLLILDEPDAHLHPEMAKMFKEIVSETLVEKFGIQVIMTTHSPTTLCWMDEECIFLMDPEDGLSSASKSKALSKLTAGLVCVHPAFKIVLVEDKADEKFHTALYLQLAYHGRLSKDPLLTFRSVAAPDDQGGGKTVVEKACKQWSQFSKETDLDQVLFGLVDKDNDDNSSLPDSVFCLPRYCHENFFADPILIFVLLMEERANEYKIKEIANSHGYELGDTLKVKRRSDLNFQGIADDVISHLVDQLNLTPSLMTAKKSIKYLNGVEVIIPDCFLSESGKDKVLPWFREAFPAGASKLNSTILLTYIEKTLLIPEDLADVYEQLVSL